MPFHMWTPDVYQGAPTPVTAFMASATKVAAFAALLRIFDGAFLTYRDQWQPVVWGLTVLTLGVGSIGALLQVDLKRLLAYSSIAHAGYLLMALETGTPKGREAALFYLFAYTFMVIGSFAVVTVLSTRGDDEHPIEGLRGLAARRPVIGSLLVLFLLAQAGIPLTSGFVAKLDVFSAAASAGDYVLVVVGAVATVIAAFAYLRVALAVATPHERRRGDRAGAPPPGRRRHVDRARDHRRRHHRARHRARGVRPLGPGRHAPHPRHHLAEVAPRYEHLEVRCHMDSEVEMFGMGGAFNRRRGATRSGGADGAVGAPRRRRRAPAWRARGPTS